MIRMPENEEKTKWCVKNFFVLVVALLCSGCNSTVMNAILPGLYETSMPGYSISWETCAGIQSEGVAQFTIVCSHMLAPQTLSVIASKDMYAADAYGNRYQVRVAGGSSSWSLAAGVPVKITFSIAGIPPGIHSFSIISIELKSSTNGVTGQADYQVLRFRNIPITWQGQVQQGASAASEDWVF